jgi:hypothetical protein
MNDESMRRSELVLFPRHCLVRVRGEAWKTYDEIWSLAGNRMGYLKNENELLLSHSADMYKYLPDMGWTFSCVCCGKVLIIALMVEINRILSNEYLL